MAEVELLSFTALFIGFSGLLSPPGRNPVWSSDFFYFEIWVFNYPKTISKWVGYRGDLYTATNILQLFQWGCPKFDQRLERRLGIVDPPKVFGPSALGLASGTNPSSKPPTEKPT